MIEWESPDKFIGTTAAIILAASAAASAGASVYAAKSQSGAARDAANAQVGAANHAADLESKAAADALAFQKEQAAADAARFEQTQHANYNQWSARENRMSDFGQALGLTPRNIPAYQSSMPGGTPQGMPAAGADPNVASFIANWQQTHPASEGIAPLADAIAKQFPNVGRYMYGQTASNNELNIGGQKYKVLGGEGTPAAYWYTPGMNDSASPASALAGLSRVVGGTPAPTYASNFNNVLTPALQAPRANYFGAN